MLLAHVDTTEDLIERSHLLRRFLSRLIVEHTNSFIPFFVSHFVKSVDDTTDSDGNILAILHRNHNLGCDLLLDINDFKGGKSFINHEHLFEIADDDSPIDQLKTVVFRAESVVIDIEEFCSESLIYDVFYFGRMLPEVFKCRFCDGFVAS